MSIKFVHFDNFNVYDTLGNDFNLRTYLRYVKRNQVKRCVGYLPVGIHD